MSNKYRSFMLMVAFIVLSIIQGLQGHELDSTLTTESYKYSIDTSPLSPLFKIYGVHYNYRFEPKSEIILGLSYMNIHYDFGNTNAPAIIIGYRRYIWKKLHFEYQLWPTYDNFYEKNEDKYYKSFDLWNEFRLGYQFDFTVSEFPLYINLQWPFGFGLFASNKPDSFKEFEKDNRFFYFPPLIFLGIKF